MGRMQIIITAGSIRSRRDSSVRNSMADVIASFSSWPTLKCFPSSLFAGSSTEYIDRIIELLIHVHMNINAIVGIVSSFCCFPVFFYLPPPFLFFFICGFTVTKMGGKGSYCGASINY